MKNVADTSTPNDKFGLLEFFDLIWKDLSGFAYLATKGNTTFDFDQTFFEWPHQKEEIVSHVILNRNHREVYYSPAIYSQASATKQHVKGSRVVWCEFDGKVPENSPYPEPNLRIRTSSEGREHWYWVLDSSIEVAALERINRGLTYELGADESGWDATQILRPPDTINHKRNLPVHVVGIREGFTDRSHFVRLPKLPPPVQPPPVENLQTPQEILQNKPLASNVVDLYSNGVQVGSRSSGLMALGYYLAESGYTDHQIFSLLLDADERWGKFSKRPDRNRRLSDIVTKARAKHPLSKQLEANKYTSMGMLTLLHTEVEIEWQIEGLLQKAGYMLITGPSGIGKTQVSLWAAQQLALGKNIFNFKVPKPIKVGFFSLEMGLPEVKLFIQQQAQAYSQDQLSALEENFRVFPIGEPILLNNETEQKQIEEVIQDEKLDGIMIDSWGSVTSESLSDETKIKPVLNWMAELQNRTNKFIWFIHHHRKATSDNRKPNKLDDIYGNQYITARTTTTLVLWPTGSSSALRAIPVKVRLAATPKPFLIYRDKNLHWTITKAGMMDNPKGDMQQLAAHLQEEIQADLGMEEQDIDTNNATSKEHFAPGDGATGF